MQGPRTLTAEPGPRQAPWTGRISLVVACLALLIAAVLAWRLFFPPWLGGVQKAEPPPPPIADRVPEAPGPDNTATRLPPQPPQPVSPPERDKPGEKERPK
ncbi:MAG TPA: hypothetical protein VEB22_01415 [Phycisphaerales bacterium]|nr:hypothetical protein [Phycisphaerales bacterium]